MGEVGSQMGKTPRAGKILPMADSKVKCNTGGDRPQDPKTLDVEFHPIEEVLHDEYKIHR